MIPFEKLTVEQKLGRVLCARLVKNKEDIDDVIELVKKEAVGCVQVPVDKNASEIIARIRAAADYPVLIVNDMELGYLPSGMKKISLLSLAACDNQEYTKAFAAKTAYEARKAGFSGCWGPVLDILYKDSPVSVSRKASDTPEGVLRIAEKVSEVFASYNFLSTGKHYPDGESALAMDTHMVEGSCLLTSEELRSIALRPYYELWNKGLLPAIMTGHTKYPSIDPEHPASLSKKVIDIFRKDGYDGLIYTDSLAMMGILQKYGEAKAMVLALEAGNDIILPNYRTHVKDVYQMMLDAYKEGLISDDRLDDAVRHVMAAEEASAKEPVAPYPVPENIDEILEAIGRDCITADCKDGVKPSIDPKEKRLFIVLTDMKYAEVGEEVITSGWYDPRRAINAIKENFPSSDILTLSEFPSPSDNETILNACASYSEVVFVSFCTTAPYMGTDSMTRRVESVIDCINISGKLSALVHFGSPLAVKRLHPIDRVILGYNAPDAQRYAFEVLSGKIEAKGKNPFPNLYK